ncbi:MAG: hypothetical protein ACP5HG_07515 [Anaerolineae bacterium]
MSEESPLSLPFLLQSLLLLQSKSFVHAAGISIEDRGLLLPAFGGVGKTSFIARVSRVPGVRVFGDDMVIVTQHGTMEPYLRPFALYEYHRELFPDFYARNQLRYKPLTLSWRIFNKIRAEAGKLMGKDWQQPWNTVRTGYVPVSPERVLGSRALAERPTKLEEVYVLQRANTAILQISPIEANKGVEFMLGVLYHEWYSQLRLLLSWLVHREQSIRGYLGAVEGIIRSAVSSCRRVNRVLIPREMSPMEFADELLQYVLR